jgi:hypothetical protein
MWLLIPLLVLGLIAVMLGVAVAVIVALAIKLMPVVLILLGAWLLLRAVRGPRDDRRAWRDTRRGRRPAPRSAPERPVVQRQRPEPRPEPGPQARPRRELPVDVAVKVEQIRRKADVLLGYADRFPPFSQDLYLVRQTAADYLPRTVDAYLELPGDDDPVLGAGGKTALHELREQLELLDSKLDDIAQDLQRQDVDRLLANRRFLEERFGMRDRPSDRAPESAPDGGPRRQGPEAA